MPSKAIAEGNAHHDDLGGRGVVGVYATATQAIAACPCRLEIGINPIT
ncbi:MAG: hypothetical protein QF893_03510 [Alphaproteobacteria bacterium]|jgi:hypothetical protein|nr:hypothetical protein [Alphaproteobacteria bacterium]